jgi:hypothetical protein
VLAKSYQSNRSAICESCDVIIFLFHILIKSQVDVHFVTAEEEEQGEEAEEATSDQEFNTG